MIYLFREGECDDLDVTAVYQVPDGVDVSWRAYLKSLGASPYPEWNDFREDPSRWRDAVREWEDGCNRMLNNLGIKSWHRDAAHRAWIESLPSVQSLPFEKI